MNPRIGSIGLTTCDRLKGLRRALLSYIKNSQRYGRTTDFVVMDDSPNAETRDDYRQMLRSLKGVHGVRIFYAGLEEKTRFAKQLVAGSGLPVEVVNFALFDVEKCGYSLGANRNALLLHTVGDAIFSTDDDTVCCAAPAPDLETGLTFASGRDPAEVWFFPDRETALQSVSFVEEDLLGVHEQLLGQSFGSILSKFSKLSRSVEPNPDSIDSCLLRRLGSANGRVAVTFNGLIGDCGWGAPFGCWGYPMGCLLLDEESHVRITKSPLHYRSACTTREILRTVNCPTLSDAAFSMAVFMGLDNRSLLPPFMPVQRGQGMIFGTTLWTCFQEAYCGHLPWALLHAPVQNRRFWPGEIFRNASGFDTAKLMIACIKSFVFGSRERNGKEGLQAIGKYLIELGSMRFQDFKESARLQASLSSGSFISLLEERLQACAESPEFWVNDVKKYLNILRKASTREDYWVPLDLIDGRSVSEAERLAQRLVLKFGQLLCWWPEMVEVAKDLRVQGQRLAKLI